MQTPAFFADTPLVPSARALPLQLPNTASVAEILINSRLEPAW